MSLYQRGEIYWSRIVRKGERFDRSTKCRNKRDAQLVEARWLTETVEAGGTLGPLKTEAARTPTTLLGIEERLWAQLATTVKSSSLQIYKHAWKPLTYPGLALNTALLSDISVEMIEEFVQLRLSGTGVFAQEKNGVKKPQPVGPSSVNGSLRILKIALRKAEDWKLIQKVPKIKLLTNENSRDYVITEEVLQEMLAHEKCTPLLQNLLPVAIDTGLRRSELTALRWSEVIFTPKRNATMGFVHVSKGKTKSAKRNVSLTDRAQEILVKMKATATTEFVFGGVTDMAVTMQFIRLRDAMKLKGCVLHSTRHTFCTDLGERGVTANVIMKLAGHANINISAKYVHPTDAAAESAIASLNSR
jgi:integrase